MTGPTGIAAPAPRVYVTVLGVGPEDVWVVDARRSGSDVDVVRIELDDVHVAGSLHTMALVLGRAAEGIAAVEAARRQGPTP